MRRTAALLLLASLTAGPALTATPALAQADPAEHSGVDESLITIEFPGGTLGDFVERLRDRSNEPLNVLLQGGAERVPLSSFHLDSVETAAAIQLATRMTEAGQTIRLSFDMLDNSGRAVYLVTATETGRRSSGHIPRDVLVVSLRELTTTLPGDPPELIVAAETVLTAVETALMVADADEKDSKIQYHPDSGLLIMAAEVRALSAASEVIERIRSDVRERRSRAIEQQQIQGLTNPLQLQEHLADIEAELQLAELNVQTSARRRDLVREEFQEFKSMVEAGAAPPSDLRHAELQLHEAEAGVQEREIQMNRLMERYEQAKAGLERARAISAGGNSDSEASQLRKENQMLRTRLADLEAELNALRARSGGNSGSRGGGTR